MYDLKFMIVHRILNKFKSKYDKWSYKRSLKNIDTLYEDDFLLIKGIQNINSKFCTLSFTGVGHAMGGMNLQKEEFISNSIKNGNVLFITDKKRTWGNSIDVKTVQNVLNDFGDFDEIIAIGNSMGGTNALLLGPLLGAQTVISFVPQYSVHKDIFKNLHNENWNLWRDSIPLIKYKTADCSQIDNVREYIFHGQNKSDMPHAEKFQKRANRIHLVFKDTDHNLCRSLKTAGILSLIIQKCIAGCSQIELEKIIVSAGLVTFSI